MKRTRLDDAAAGGSEAAIPLAERPPRLLSAAACLILVAIGWGALAFGAVYPWAYWPLLALGVLVGLLMIRVSGSVAWPRSVAAGLTMGAAVILLQVVPLPQPVVDRISPNAGAFLRQFDLSFSLGTAVGPAGVDEGTRAEPWRTFSIDPRRTWRGLAFVVGLGLFFLGATSVFSLIGPLGVVRRLVMLAVIVAVAAIVQAQTASRGQNEVITEIYGFWTPRYGGNPFGPFVNRNHFAAWMVMTIPLALGLLWGEIWSSLQHVKRDWRNRILWLSSPSGSKAVLGGFGILLMGLSLILSASRSGLLCFTAALIVGVGFVVAAPTGRARRTMAIACLAFVFAMIVGWAGSEAALRRFSTTKRDSGGRLAAWRDTGRIIRDFPVTGTGFNTFGTAMFVYQSSNPAVHYQEAHNEYLQIVAEGGVAVAVPVSIVVVLFVREVWRRFREGQGGWSVYWLRAGAVTGLLAIALQSLVEFSLQIPGNAALFAVLAAVAVHRPLTLPTDATRL